MNTPAIGIDFGTTTSSVAVYQNDKPITFNNEFGDPTTPSVVAFTEDEELIGQPAVDQMMSNLKNTVFDVKRMLGKTYKELKEEIEHWPFEVKNEEGYPKFSVEYKGSMITLSPEEMCSKILRKMKGNAEEYLGMNVSNAVILIPSSFNAAQRDAMMEAGKLAGLNVLRIFPEPIAAAIAHRLKEQDEQEKNILVFHLGGGTFDISVLKMKEDNFRVMGSYGDTHFGGKEFDNCILGHLVEEFDREYQTDIAEENKEAIHALRIASEKLKQDLSKREETYIEENALHDGIDFHTIISRDTFERLSDGFVGKIKVSIDHALRDAELQKTEIGEILLAGGSTHIPKIKKLLTEYFGETKLRQSISGDEAHVHGAAYVAAFLNGDLQGVTLPTERVALSKGTDRANGQMFKLIDRDSTIPCKHTATFITYEDEQKAMEVQLYEGERPLVADNLLLGTLIISGLTQARRGTVHVDVTFEIDDNGILHASAKERKTKKVVSLKIEKSKIKTSAAVDRMVRKAEQEKETDSAELKRIQAREDLDDCARDMLSRIKYDHLENRSVLFTIEGMRDQSRKIITWLTTNEDRTKAVYDEKKKELEDLWWRTFWRHREEMPKVVDP